MEVSDEIYREESLFMSVSEALLLMVGFGSLLISLISLIVDITKNDIKK